MVQRNAAPGARAEEDAMPIVTHVYWRDIPAQVIVGKGRRGAKAPLPERFEQAIDRVAMRIGAKDEDAYLSEWHRVEIGEQEGDPAEIAAAEAARLDATFDAATLKTLIDADGFDPAAREHFEPGLTWPNFGRSSWPFCLSASRVRPRPPRPGRPWRYSNAARGILDRGDAAHRREGRGFPRAAAGRHARLHRPYRRHRDRRHGRHRARLRDEGFEPMPHFPARSIPGPATLADWIRRYQAEAGVTQGLLLGGGIATPRGEYHSSMQLLESGFFDDAGFTHLHVAGHPEGNRDIDPDGGEAEVMAALKWKQDFANRSDARFAIATQFAFEADGVVAWAERLAAAGIEMPVHLGVAGPAKLQTLIKFAIACGVGKSLACCRSARRMSPSSSCRSSRRSSWPIWPRARPPGRHRISSASTSSRSAGSRPMPNGR
jgi:hypothetical protein